MTIKFFSEKMRTALTAVYGEREAGQMAAILFRHFAGWNRADLLLKGNEEISPELLSRLEDTMERLLRFEPIQYIIGVTGFCGLDINVAPGVLIPRPETEELADLVIRENLHRQYQEFCVLDIGTGSGCLAIALGKTFPYAKTDAIDISAAAIGIAMNNAALNKTVVTFRQLDILNPEAAGQLPGYHLIVSNPPYVTESERTQMNPNVTEHEPASALFVPDRDPLLFYRAIGMFAFQHLIRPGLLYVEINERFGAEVKGMLQGIGFERAEVIRDLSGKDRFVRAEAKHTMADTSYWMVDKQLP